MHRCTFVVLVLLNTGLQFAPVHAEGPDEENCHNIRTVYDDCPL